MVENLQQLIQKATLAKDQYNFKWNNEYIASCLGMNTNDMKALHTQFKKEAMVYVKRAMERGSKIDSTSVYSSACNTSWSHLISSNVQLLESSEQIKGLDTGVEWINLLKWFWTKLFKDSKGKKRRRREKHERDERGEREGESRQRKKTKSKAESRVRLDQHSRHSSPLPDRSRNPDPTSPNLVDKMQARYSTILEDFHAQVTSCLERYQGRKTVWKTHLTQMSLLLANVHWAQIGTEKDSPLGLGSVAMEDADVWYLTPKEFECLIESCDPIRKCLVIRQSWDDVSDQGKIETFLQHLQRMFGTSTLEVQDISGEAKGTKHVSCDEYVAKIQYRLGEKVDLSNENLPWNLLNLKAKAVPGKDGLEDIILDLARFNLLNVVCERGEGALKSMELDEHQRADFSHAGKAKHPPIIYRRAIDMQSCLTFGLYAQRGSFSGWHVDVLNGTYVTCLTGLKAWFIHLPLTDKEKDDLAKDGPDWEPDLSRVRLILLRPGDTLYMPPGELVAHAPMTIVDCLMKGRMLWDMLRFRDILTNTSWITENNKASNESIPEQLIICWPELEKMTEKEPSSVELISGDGTTEPLQAFFKTQTTIMRAALSCKCGKVCRDNCPCLDDKHLASNWKCTTWCHPDAKRDTTRACMTS
jgi:hypothetical protein